MSKFPTAFVSYSWDNDEHKEWVRNLATRLRSDGIDVKLDQWEAIPGDKLPDFMASSIQNNDFVLIVCTPMYKEKSSRDTGGVRYEGDIITSEMFVLQNHRKYIPILREGNWEESAPIWLFGKYYVDLRGEKYDENNYQNLLITLKGERPSAPPVGSNVQEKTPSRISATKSLADNPHPTDQEWEEVKIVGIILEEVTAPRNDGTRGSALYTIPLKLSRQPSREWAQLFIRNWDHPPRYSLMHRPGIARVSGDKVILEGTTIEELETYHQETLKLALKETNKLIAEFEREKRQKALDEEEQRRKHTDNVKNIANRLDFD